MFPKLILVISIVFLFLCVSCNHKKKHDLQQEKIGQWISLFNGKNLDGWIPKFSGYKLGVNYKNTFRVENGLLTVSYDNYDCFHGQYGHLFYKKPFTNYKIKVVYRFIGKQVDCGAGWAYRNNGLMLFCQKPESMGLNQPYPASIETQLLGGNGKDPRPTANICTPHTRIKKESGQLSQRHCIESTSETYAGDQWVTVEVVVHSNGEVKNIVNGDTVFAYSNPQYAKNDSVGKSLAEEYGNTFFKDGYISIQAESAPTQFKKIEIMPLGKNSE